MGIYHVYDKAMDLIFPPRCMVCLDIVLFDAPRWFCAECGGLLAAAGEDVCIRCGAPADGGTGAGSCDCKGHDFLDGNRALLLYDDIAKRLIYNFKYYNHPEIARGLGAYMEGKVDLDYFKGADCLTYVPAHRSRYIKRGYNQAYLLARQISRLTGVRLTGLLERKKDTKPQSILDHASRVNNLKEAFVLKSKHDIYKKSIIIIDDIYTTGATLEACAEALKAGGAARAAGYTLAVALKNTQFN